METTAAKTTHLSIKQGSSFQKTITYTPDTENSPLIVFTAGRMQIRASETSTEVLLSLTTANGRLVLSALNKVQIVLSSTETAALSWDGTAVYDLELYDEVGSPAYVDCIAKGNVTITKEITR